MVTSARVHDQYFCPFVRLLDHVRQMMTVFFGERGSENDKVERVAAQGFLNSLTADRIADVVASLLHGGSLRGHYIFVGFCIENFDGWLGRRSGQG
jgi:hypothetical protein